MWRKKQYICQLESIVSRSLQDELFQALGVFELLATVARNTSYTGLYRIVLRLCFVQDLEHKAGGRWDLFPA